VQVAQQAVGLAQDALQQARDRFAAGVATGVEVVQAQQALATAEENYITSLNNHNVAKLLLARSVGEAEQQVRNYLKGTP
jgi:outer membrane protein TolC